MARFDLEDGSYDEPRQLPQPTYGTGAPVPASQPAAPAPAQPQGFGNSTYDQIANLYRTTSGGSYTPTQQDVSQWGTNVDSRYMNQIGGAIQNWWNQQQKAAPAPAAPPPPPAAPAQAQPSGGGPVNGDYRSWFLGLTNGRAPTPSELTAMAPMLQQHGISLAPNAAGVNGKIRLPDGRIIDVIQGADRGGQAWQWLEGGGAPAGGSYAATNPFDDPATKSYIDMLNGRITQLQQPQQNPELDRLLAYMTKQFEQLQQPVYSDAQRNVIQTQFSDPLERQRTAEKQRVVQQMANRGMGPGDGPTIQALQDVDRHFDQMRTTGQRDFATSEINQGRENQKQALDIASQAASLRNGVFQQQESRDDRAVGYGRQVPDIAQQRLATAISLLNGNRIDPTSVMNSMNSYNQQDRLQSQNDSQNAQDIMAALAKIFGL